MINFSRAYRKRQLSITVEDIEFPVKTDFYFWLAFENIITGKAVTPDMLDEFDFLYQWQKPEDKQAGFHELLGFYENRQPLPRPSGKHLGVTAFDWELDSEYIYAAFRQQYGIDLIEQDIHWHDFLALFNGLVDTKLNQIISARYDDGENGTAGADMRHSWEIIKDAPDLPPAAERRKNADWPVTENTNG
jgi:hypothetical protein